MKLLWLPVLVMVLVCPLLSGSPCVSCRTELPPQAQFCLRCGRPQPPAAARLATNIGRDQKADIITMFSAVDEYEKVIGTKVYSLVVGRYPEFRALFQRGLQQFNRRQTEFPEELQLLAKAYSGKFKILAGMVEIMKNLRIDPAEKSSRLLYGDFAVQAISEIIRRIRETATFPQAVLKALRTQVRNVSGRMKKYRVTAKYLSIGRTRIHRNDVIVVTNVKDTRAHVLYLGATANMEILQGWVGLASLVRHTTWEKGNESYFQPVE